MSELVGFNITPDSGTTLRKMLKHNLEPYLDKFEIISGAASKEHSLGKAIKNMVDDWEPVVFNLVAYKDSGVCSILIHFISGILIITREQNIFKIERL